MQSPSTSPGLGRDDFSLYKASLPTPENRPPGVCVLPGAGDIKPESTLSSADLDPRRRKILFRCWRRGMREMDYLLGHFADAELPGLPEAELADLERLLDVPDRDVLSWLTGEAPAPAEHETPLLRRLKAFHTHSGPINV
jgi:antitoxin CptB